MKTVNILGTEYKIEFQDFDNPELKGKNRSGYTFFDEKLIVCEDFDTDDEWKDESEKAKTSRRNNVLRHELVHAFLWESGLAQNSEEVNAWAMNEEMVDWFAIQSPKIFKVFQELDCTE